MGWPARKSDLGSKIVWAGEHRNGKPCLAGQVKKKSLAGLARRNPQSLTYHPPHALGRARVVLAWLGGSAYSPPLPPLSYNS
eukprot:scaffold10011_cov97-Isochrysis_galbana.AAC.8